MRASETDTAVCRAALEEAAELGIPLTQVAKRAGCGWATPGEIWRGEIRTGNFETIAKITKAATDLINQAHAERDAKGNKRNRKEATRSPLAYAVLLLTRDGWRCVDITESLEAAKKYAAARISSIRGGDAEKGEVDAYIFKQIRW